MKAGRLRAAKIFLVTSTLVLLNFVIFPGLHTDAQGAWVNYQTSPVHGDVRSPGNSQYQVRKLYFGITDNEPGRLYFYLNFLLPVKTNQYSDGLGSYANISIDVNGDNLPDYLLQTNPKLPYSDNLIHDGLFIDKTSGSGVFSSKCSVRTFTDISTSVDWIGFSILKDCLPVGTSFGILGNSVFDPDGKNLSDRVPDVAWKVILPGNDSITINPKPENKSFADIPSAPDIGINSIINPASPPDNLVSLAAEETKSVVTVVCGGNTGSGWVANVKLSTTMLQAGYLSYIITNHHVVKDCIGSRAITIYLSNQSEVAGYLWAWEEGGDVAGIAMRIQLPSLSFEGVTPEQGWWTAVVGSPFGFPGILTEGIISSANTVAFLVTTTAHINPGNSGGPAFDRNGRVIGLATSKILDAEGFGIIHGAPLLCGAVIICASPSLVWTLNSNLASDLNNQLNKDLLNQTDALLAAGRLLLEGANSVLDHSLANLAEAIKTYPTAKLELLTFAGLAPKAPGSFVDPSKEVNAIALFASAVTTYEKLTAARIAALGNPSEASPPKPSPTVKPSAKATAKLKTITCIKGAVVKKVTGTTPKCPTGYKLKV